MNTRVFSAYNESSKKQLASGIGVVDSVDEPIKVLKILMEGLAPASGSGIWITRFHGLPIARSYAPFDLIYLDENHRVVHDVEITQTSNFVPFKGLPTSALILPPRSIASSKTFTGDRIALHAIETAPPPSEQAKDSPPAPPPATAAPPAKARRLNITLEVVEEAPTPIPPAPLGVLKPAKRTRSSPPDNQPSAFDSSNIPKPPEGSEEILKQPKIRRTTPPATPENPPPPVIEPDSHPVASPSIASDSALSAPIPSASIPDTSIPDTPIPDTPGTATPELPKLEPELAAPAPAEPVSAEPTSIEPATPPLPVTEPVSAAEPFSFEPPLETPVAPVPEASSYAAPIPETPAPMETSNDPAGEPSIETSPSEATPPSALAPVQLSSLDVRPLHPEPDAETASAAPQDWLPATLSALPIAPTPKEAPAQLAPSDSPETAPQPESPSALDKPQQQKAMDIARRWDVKLLYSLFPELHPSFRPELTMPSVDPIKYLKSEHDEDDKLPAKLQVLSWLYPELELETLEKRQRSQRRAPRIENPGLVGYFYTSGKAEPHEIRNFSVTGFYMKTKERWLPGTVIRITLQMVDSDGSNPGDSLTLHSRVVNWDENGGGFEFVLPGFLE